METLSNKEEERYAELQLMAVDFARDGSTELLEGMIRSGLPVNLADAKGNSLLMLAAYNGNEETAKMLLANGADVDRRNDRGQTPLGGVAFKGYATIARLLVEHGADLNADNGGGTTPATYATLFGRYEVAEYLQSKGASTGHRSWLRMLSSIATRLRKLFKRSSKAHCKSHCTPA